MNNFITAEALRLYETVHKQGVLGRIWSMLTGQPRRLLDLETIRRTVHRPPAAEKHQMGGGGQRSVVIGAYVIK